MKHFGTLILSLLIVLPSLAQTKTQNYVYCRTFLDAKGQHGVEKIVYCDGLGRPVETVSTQYKGSYSAAITEYDNAGRVENEWVATPYSKSNEYMELSDVKSAAKRFHSDQEPYKYNVVDILDRTKEMWNSGEKWHKGKIVTNSYETNSTNEVRRFYSSISDTLLSDEGYCNEGTLYVERTKDEDGRTISVYTDLMGNKILERRNDNNDTYYVYNEYNQLRFVLTPAYQESYDLQLDAYEYRYDSHGRCIYKRVPGCGAEYFYYDYADKLIFSQSAVLRAKGKLLFHLYDNFNREVVTGLCSIANYTAISTMVVSCCYNGTGELSGYATNIKINNPIIKKINFYDDYGFVKNVLGFSYFKDAKLNFETPPSIDKYYASAKSLQTGSINYSDEGDAEVAVMYYDVNGNQIVNRSYSIRKGQTDTFSHYTFSEKLEAQRILHYKETIGEEINYHYDTSSDQLETVFHKLNNSEPIALAINTYDGIGRKESKTMGFFKPTMYKYNVRNWLTAIQGSYFTEDLYYEDSYNGSKPQFGGNISSMEWRVNSQNENKIVRGYNFTYDELNRLIKADYIENQKACSKYSTKYAYDKMGNITRLQRNGLHDDGVFDIIDNLTYEYNGNQVTKITDKVEGPFYKDAMHFTDNADEDVEYEHDGNGNMTKDLNRQICNIEYNYLNLPTRILFADGSENRYVYDANGVKLQLKYIKNNQVVLTIDYSGNLIYENNKLKQILVDGGYITPADSTNKEPVYHFYVQDHLGNNRLVVTQTGTIEQVNHYYPFGGLMGESKNLSSSQRYKYNGKELDRMNGLDSYDYGARLQYAPVGRWMSVDPLAEVDYNISPYVYCGDNPVIYTDPTGKVFGIDNVIGGLASGAIEVGTQIVEQYIGKSKNYHISWSKVGVAVAEGFVTSGASTGVRVATKVASALANSNIDNKGKGVKGVAMGTVKNIAVNGVAKVGSRVANKAVGKVMGSRINSVSNKMISSKKSLKKQISRVGVNAKHSYKAAVAIQSGQKKAVNNLRRLPGVVSEMTISGALGNNKDNCKNEKKK